MKANIRRQIALTLCAVAGTYFVTLAAQVIKSPIESSPVDLYTVGLTTEEVDMDYVKAAQLYRLVIEDFDERRQKAANAVFRLGECLRKLQRFEEAKVQYARILREFPDQVELTQLSHQFLNQPTSSSIEPRQTPPLGKVTAEVSPSPKYYVGARKSAAAVMAQIADRKVGARADERAEILQCVDNLKNIGWARRIYAADNNDQFPEDWSYIKTLLASPSVMVCPADPSALNPTTDWNKFNFKNSSYEFLSPGGVEGGMLSKVVFYCRIHGHIALSDGGVWQNTSEIRQRLKSALEQNAKH